nr:hypothetical protein 6 [Balneolaceae bacterium]
MPNPIQLERRYAELMEILEGSYSYRYQWQEAGCFLDLIREEFSTYDTYCIQIVQQLPEFANPLSIAGINPKVFINLNNQLNELQSAIPQVQGIENLRLVQASIQQSLLFLFACLGELEKGIQEIGCSDYSFSSESNSTGMDVGAQIQQALDSLKTSQDQRLLEMLAGVKRWWDAINSNKGKVVYVPVVEKIQGKIRSGRIRELSARVVGKEEKEDYYEDYYAVVGAEKGRWQRRPNTVSAVRDLLKTEYPEAADTYFHLQFSYNLKLGLQHGRSYELPSAISAFCTISEQLSNRKLFSPLPNIAATGEIGDSGDIEGVDVDSIRAKTESAFFSWITCLLVPESQKELFEKQLNELQDSYPCGELLIVGLSKFSNFLFDRRIVSRKIESRLKYLFKKAWAKRFSLSSLSTIVVLLAIIGSMWYGAIDKNPVEGKYRDKQLHIYNTNGDLIKTFYAGYRMEVLEERNSTGGYQSQVRFSDINDDGINEVFFGISSESKGSRKSTLKAWSVTGDSLIWELPLQFEINFPRKNSIVEKAYLLNELHITQLENGTKTLIVSADLQPMFPQVIASVDVNSGKIKQTYVHPGHFYDMVMVDMNDDGVEEIIAGGVSNAYWKAAIVALDVSNLEGHSPTRGDYIVKNFEPAEELSYILVPKTILGKSYGLSGKYNRVRRIRASLSDSSLSFEIIDANPPNVTSKNKPYIIAFLDLNTLPKGIGTSDDYDALIKRQYQKGQISQIPDFEYFESFKDSLLHWDGDKFIKGMEVTN